METLYIKGESIKPRNQIVLEIGDYQVICPEHKMLVEYGWELYIPYQPTEQDKFEQQKQNLYNEILNYDSSDAVNVFFIGELPMWLDKSTRAGLLLRFQAEKSQGLTNTNLWYDNMSFTLNVDMAIQMLYALELYASACYDNTQLHIAIAKSLTTIDEVETYDYTVGYPEKLYFNL